MKESIEQNSAKVSVSCLALGVLQTNCYILVNEETREAVIVDPADRPEAVTAFISERGLAPKAVFLTHGHFDHGLAAAPLASHFHIPVCAAEKERELLADWRMNCSEMLPGVKYELEPGQCFADGDVLSPAGFEIRILETPGHTAGSCCFYLPADGILISGDTLFLEGAGRTDMPTGNMGALIHSLREKIASLPDSTEVYPGHGGKTSIGYEKRNNPYLSEGEFWNE